MTKKIKFLKDYYCEVLAFKKDKIYTVEEEDDQFIDIKDETNISTPISKEHYEYEIIEQQQGHPHAGLMAIAAERAKYKINWQEDFQFKYIIDGKENWCQMLPKTTFDCHIQYRLKPRTIKIGNREINAPERETPNEGQTYYIPYFCVFNVKYSTYVWRENDFHMKYHLENGLVFLNKEDAIAATEAMIELLRGSE